MLATVFLFFLFSFGPTTAQIAVGVDCALTVEQRNDQGELVLLYSDTTLLLHSMPATGFLTAFSVDIKMTQIDSVGCAFNLHTVTLGPSIHNYAKQYRVEYGLPARMAGIIGKDGVEYVLSIKPLGRTEVDTTGCSLDHRPPGAFAASPSGYMDFHYVRTSFGEYYWNVPKGMFEERYRLFRAMNNFNMPGKFMIYLCPCPLFSVIWDDRFGMMVDPTRNAAYSIYTKNFNSADPFLVLHAAVYKNYGYAPSFLSEGLAGFLSFAEYGMKEIVAAGSNLELDSFLDTYAYYNINADLADKTAASFTKYLINQYSTDKFLTMYKQAHDLNLRNVMVATYGKSISELENEWLNYIDTVSISQADLSLYASLAEGMFNYPLMYKYGVDLLSKASSRQDSLSALDYVIRASFSRGDYYAATDYQQQLITLQPDYGLNWIALAGYQLMNGLYAESKQSLNEARALDSTNQLIDFNLALNDLYTGKEAAAWQRMAGIIMNGSAGGPQAETRALYGNKLAQSSSEEDQALAIQYCTEAINRLGQSIRSGNASAEAYLWTGIAYLGLGDTGNAWDHLHIARFLELRPFYLGMTSLWLGKVADTMGEHEVAKEYYSVVISGAAADYHQRQARQLSQEAYRQ